MSEPEVTEREARVEELKREFNKLMALVYMPAAMEPKKVDG
jgi:hypothetical protein